jgi:hypothetical protein
MDERQRRYKVWCFTINNYTEEDVEKMRGLGSNPGTKYLVFGRECGESGTKHLQGYVSLCSGRRFDCVKGMLGDRAHIERAKGSAGQNRTYCTKDGDFEEFGQVPKSPGRGGREAAEQRVMETLDRIRAEGTAAAVAADPFLFVRHQRLEHVALLLSDKGRRSTKPAVFWLHGRTGVGKTRFVLEQFPSAYVKMNGNKWWDGYTQDDVVVLDDFRELDMPFNMLLRLLDRYPMMVEKKGGVVNFNSRIIFVTCCEPPEQLYQGTDECIEQLTRRIDKTIAFPNAISWSEMRQGTAAEESDDELTAEDIRAQLSDGE